MMNGDWPPKQDSWSPVEKKAARYAFDLAYKKPCEMIREKVRKKAEKASSPADLWKIHDYLSKERRRTDQLFDYRYSVLLQVFAVLLHQGLIHTDDLAGLSDDKLEKIERWAQLTKGS
jgi:Photoprotection regulator fluorescence recovery protein